MELAGRLGLALDAESMKFIAVNKKQETNVPGYTLLVISAGRRGKWPRRLEKAASRDSKRLPMPSRRAA